MTYVALLRGINVGGNRKVDMRRLKDLFERSGMRDVRTYINSGNVIFDSDSGRDGLTGYLEDAIETEFGFAVKVVLRDSAEMAAIVQALPESWANGAERKCDVLFLSETVDNEGVLSELTIKPGIDDVKYVPGALLWCVEREKVTRSGLMKIVGTPLYAQMTVRNCNTARKLAALMA